MSAAAQSRGVEFTVYGDPVPQGSKRAFHGNVVEMAGKRLRSYRQDLNVTARQAMGDAATFTGPVEVRITFFLARPKSHYGTGRNAAVLKANVPVAPAKVPDIDKLARAVLDALTGPCFKDDAQVCGLVVSKLWAASGETATAVAVSPLS
jgi:Holliday junction resolvase RusA-like endonuclease